MSSDLRSNKLTIEFGSPEAAEHFAVWLSGQGEQDYWAWMEYREQEELGDITATIFDYFSGQDESFPANDARRYKNAVFLGDGVIRTRCGRLDKRG